MTLSAVVAAPATAAVRDTACGTAMPSTDIADIVELSDTVTLTGADSLARLEPRPRS